MRTAERGTTNTNTRGSSYDRRRRKQWLCDTFGDGKSAPCFSCDRRLPLGRELEADRIIPGILGGTYMRTNIRPACGDCNIVWGNLVKDLIAKEVDPEKIIWICIEGELPI